MASTSGTDIPAHDEEFWMEDGNLVLVAGRIAFKVYKGLLAMQSPLFADMFATTDAAASNKYEGCPVVEMHDSPEDLRHLLRVALPNRHRMFYMYSTEKSFTFHQLSSLVRLGHKYQIDDVQDQALAALQKYFAPYRFEDLGSLGRAKITPDWGVELIHLSRLTNNSFMLPIAFYLCTVVGSKVVDGWRREDGSVQHLSPEDLKRCFAGYAQVELRKGPMTSRIFDAGPSSSCNRPARCTAKLLERYLKLSPTIPLLGGYTDVIDRYFRPHICDACANTLKAREVAERRKLWKELPTIFKL